MKKSRWLMLLIVVAAVSLLGGAIGERLGIIPTGGEYKLGTAFLAGSTAFPAAHGSAPYESGFNGNSRTLRVQLLNAPELARTTLNIFIDGAQAGELKLDAKGGGSLEVEVNKKATALPPILDGSLVEIKTADGKLVASGSY